MSNFVLTRTPVRFSLDGGGSDLDSYYRKFGGAITSMTINKYVYTMIERRSDDRVFVNSCDYKDSQFVKSSNDGERLLGAGLKIPVAACKRLGVTGVNVFVASEIGGGTGLGTSCAVAVNLLNALANYAGRPMTKHELADQAYHLCHDDLRMFCGRKDATVTAYGGLVHATYDRNDSFTVESLRLPSATMKELRRWALLFDTGMRRNSDTILEGQHDLDYDDPANGIHVVKEAAIRIRELLEVPDFPAIGRVMDESWRRKRQAVPHISNSMIDAAYEAAISAGALGGRISGAGNGGILIIFCPPSDTISVTARLTAMGLKPFDWDFDTDGSKVLVNL